MDPYGVLLVDKPAGPTSHDVVGGIRMAAGTRKVGHAGTLDPFASGLLLLLLGPATRLSEYFIGLDKDYEATIHLGRETTSHDPEGEVVSEDDGWARLSRNEVETAMGGLRGRIMQKPPILSAKKVQGEASHRRVRRGEEVELEPVEVTVHALEITTWEPPSLSVAVRCSSGTYIRALARDLGRVLGVGGHLSSLRRTGIGDFLVASAAPFSALQGPAEIEGRLLPPALALSHLPAVEVDPEQAKRIRQGQFVPVQGGEDAEGALVRVLLNGELVAMGNREGGQLRPRKVLATREGTSDG